MLLHLTNPLQTTTAATLLGNSKGIERGTAEFLFIFIETGTEFDLSFYFTCNLLQVECHPTAFRDAWKLNIQGKPSISIDQQCLTFAASHYSLAEITTVSWNCAQDESAQAGIVGNSLKHLQYLQSILNTKVLIETGNLPGDLSSTAVGEFCDVGIQCKPFFVLFENWILVFPSQIFQEERQYHKEICNLCIEIDRDLQLKECEVNLNNCITEEIPVPFSYCVTSRHLAVLLLMIEQAVLYCQGKKMQLSLQCINSAIVDKAADGRSSGPLFKVEITYAVSKQDHMLTAIISQSYCWLRCLLVTAIAFTIPLDASLYLFNVNKRRRISASQTHMQNLDSNILCCLPKGLYWISQKVAGQSQQLQLDCLQSYAKANNIFGPRILKSFKENGFHGANVKQSGVGATLGQQISYTSQPHSSTSLSSDSSSASNSAMSYSSSHESYISLEGFAKKTNMEKGKYYMKSDNSVPLAVANKGTPGFDVSRSCIPETVLVASGPILACEFLNAPMSSAAGFHFNCEHNINVNTEEMISPTSISQPATAQEIYAAPNSEPITGHYLSSDDTFRFGSASEVRRENRTENLLSDEEEEDMAGSMGTCIPSRQILTSNPQIEISIDPQCQNDKRNCSQPLGCLKETPDSVIHGSDSKGKVIVNCSDQVSIHNDQAWLEESMDTKITSCAGQSGSDDRNTHGSVNRSSNNKSAIITKGKDESYRIVSGTGSSSTKLIKESSKVCHGNGDGSGSNCRSGRYSENNYKVEGANDIKLVHNDERVDHSTLVEGTGEAQVNSCHSGGPDYTLEHHVKGKKGAGSTTGSEGSSNGSNHSFAYKNSYGMAGKGNNYCIWQKVHKNHRDNWINDPKTIDCVQLQSEKDLQSGPQINSLGTILQEPPRNSHECGSWGRNCKEKFLKEPEDYNEHSSLHGQIALKDASGKFSTQVEPPASQLIGQEASVPNVPLRAKERYDGGRLQAHVTRTGKGIWARKMGSSQLENGKFFSQKGDIDVSRQSIYPESLNADSRNLQYSSCSKTQNATPYGLDTVQFSRNVFPSARSNAQNQSSLNQMLPFSGALKSVGQATLQTKPQANHMKSSGQLGESRLWKERTTINSEKRASRERNNERHRISQQVIQKWVPVESKSSAVERGSSTDKEEADSQGNDLSRRMAKEGRQKEDESTNSSLSSSADSCTTDASAETSIHKGAIKIGHTNVQTDKPRCGLLIPPKNDMDTSVHVECAASEPGCVSDDLCKSFSTAANDASSSDVESNKMVQRLLKAIHASYECQKASEFIAHAIGSPLSEFEKVLDAVSPVIIPVSDKQHCNSNRNHLTKRLLCSCQVANIPLKNIWQWYEEHGNYGLEVKAQDSQHSVRPGIDGNLFRAYFVPFLSGMQLYGSSMTSQASSCTDVQNGVHKETNTEFGNLPPPSTHLAKPTIEDDSGVPEFMGSSSYSCSCDGNCASRCNHFMENFFPLFEFFECEQPHQRKPMFDKIRELTRSDASSNSQLCGNPRNLNSIRIGDLHPASWFAVAWYPIYRIPEGHLRAAFLTYHSLGRFSYRGATSNPLGGADCSVIAPVVGLQSYSSQAECWFEPRKCCKSFPVEGILLSPTKVLRERLRTLEETAASMTKGLIRKGPNYHMNKHADYEFFLGRRR